MNTSTLLTQYKIPVAINMHTHTPEPILDNKDGINTSQSKLEPRTVHQTVIPTQINSEEPIQFIQPLPISKIMVPMHTGNDSDDIMMQLEKLFHTDQTDDDLFDATFNNVDPKRPQNQTPVTLKDSITKTNDFGIENPSSVVQFSNDLVVMENQAAQIRSLDERLATLTGILINNESKNNQTNVPDRKEERKSKNAQREKELKKKKMVSKWHCEEYFLKKDLLETLYQIGDTNRNKLARVGKVPYFL